MSTDEIEKAITEKANELYANACKKYKLEQRKLFVFFDLKGTSAGCASPFGVVKFNLFMARNNFDAFMIDTVPHEVAHVIVFSLAMKHRKHYKPHGLEWKYVVEEMGYIPSRTHNFEPEKKARQFIYKCLNCGCTIKVSTRMHNKVQKNGEYNYLCPKCRGHVKFIEEE